MNLKAEAASPTPHRYGKQIRLESYESDDAMDRGAKKQRFFNKDKHNKLFDASFRVEIFLHKIEDADLNYQVLEDDGGVDDADEDEEEDD